MEGVRDSVYCPIQLTNVSVDKKTDLFDPFVVVENNCSMIIDLRYWCILFYSLETVVYTLYKQFDTQVMYKKILVRIFGKVSSQG